MPDLPQPDPAKEHQLTALFVVDGFTVYRFKDSGEFHYIVVPVPKPIGEP